MPGTKIVLFADRTGLVVEEEAEQIVEKVSSASRSQGFSGFIELTAGGTTVFVAADKILYLQPE